MPDVSFLYDEIDSSGRTLFREIFFPLIEEEIKRIWKEKVDNLNEKSKKSSGALKPLVDPNNF